MRFYLIALIPRAPTNIFSPLLITGAVSHTGEDGLQALTVIGEIAINSNEFHMWFHFRPSVYLTTCAQIEEVNNWSGSFPTQSPTT